MAVKIGAMQLAKMRNQAESLMKRAGGVKAKAENAVNSVVRTAEVGAAAFAMGAINGRYGGVEIAGVPADLGGAVALHALAFLGVAGKSSNHLHALGDGLLASYATTLGKGVGLNMKAKALGGGSAVKGAKLTPAELRELAGQGATVPGASVAGEAEESEEPQSAGV